MARNKDVHIAWDSIREGFNFKRMSRKFKSELVTKLSLCHKKYLFIRFTVIKNTYSSNLPEGENPVEKPLEILCNNKKRHHKGWTEVISLEAVKSGSNWDAFLR